MKKSNFRIPKSIIPSPKKIAIFGAYDILWVASPLNYNKILNVGKRNEN